MIAIKKQRQILALAIPTLIFIACTLITFSTKFKAHSTPISIGILLDVLLIAPLACYFILRKNNQNVYLPVRFVFIAGTLITTLLLSKTNSQAFEFVKTWLFPFAEISFIGFIIWKFYSANKTVNTGSLQKTDFLIYCRALLTSVFKKPKLANCVASEFAVFYYAFSRKAKNLNPETTFTSYKESGVLLIFSSLLFILLVETVGMHFLFLLWNKTAAIILTSLSVYTCLQLFAHIRALITRPTVIYNNTLLLRNGILGGDVVVELSNIKKTEITDKTMAQENVIKLSLTKNLESHNMAIHLIKPVTVIKAFGIEKTAGIILAQIDRPETLIAACQNLKQAPV